MTISFTLLVRTEAQFILHLYHFIHMHYYVHSGK